MHQQKDHNMVLILRRSRGVCLISDVPRALGRAGALLRLLLHQSRLPFLYHKHRVSVNSPPSYSNQPEFFDFMPTSRLVRYVIPLHALALI